MQLLQKTILHPNLAPETSHHPIHLPSTQSFGGPGEADKQAIPFRLGAVQAKST
jgi:hypothetical protein